MIDLVLVLLALWNLDRHVECQSTQRPTRRLGVRSGHRKVSLGWNVEQGTTPHAALIGECLVSISRSALGGFIHLKRLAVAFVSLLVVAGLGAGMITGFFGLAARRGLTATGLWRDGG